MSADPSATILVVDDETPIREVLSDLLKDAGYRVLTAMNGVDALGKISSAQPDLVLTDVMMPVMDGHQLLLRLRDNPHLQGLAVVIMSAAPRLQFAQDGQVAAVLSKPFDFELLLQIVRYALASRQPASN